MGKHNINFIGLAGKPGGGLIGIVSIYQFITKDFPFTTLQHLVSCMEARKTLKRPASWLEFESLCKKLWGEIWDHPEIQKNGRSGQAQNGVDISGKPKIATGYYGIQCKAKDENLLKELTPQEIEEEIQKAMSFKPSLLKLYIATTASKNAKLEEFVRIRNLENIANGLFEVHLYSWEDITDLIFENRETEAFYLKNSNYKTRQEAELTFGNRMKEIKIFPIYQNTTTLYGPIVMGKSSSEFSLHRAIEQNMKSSLLPMKLAPTKINHSYCPIELLLTNTGSDVIEDWKVNFLISGEGVLLDYSNLKGSFPVRTALHNYDITLDENEARGHFQTEKKVLVGHDKIPSDKFFINPTSKHQSLILHWDLISRDYKTDGELTILVEPSFKDIYKTEYANQYTTESSVVLIGDYVTEED